MTLTAYRAEIETAAHAHALDPHLVEAVVLVESSGYTHAFRHEAAFFRRYLADHPRYAGANPLRVSSSYGLMQVMYPVAVEHGLVGAPEQLFVPEVGLEYGCRHLRMLVEWAQGDQHAALGAYNGGKAGNRPGAPPRNQSYVTKVLGAHARVLEARGA
jgi:soluble lytic murein transglycosylase-like protein